MKRRPEAEAGRSADKPASSAQGASQQQQQDYTYGKVIPRHLRVPAHPLSAAAAATTRSAKREEEGKEKFPPIPKRMPLRASAAVVGGNIQKVPKQPSAGDDSSGAFFRGDRYSSFEDDDGYCGLRLEATTHGGDVASNTRERKSRCLRGVSKEEWCPLNLQDKILVNLRGGKPDLQGRVGVHEEQRCPPRADTSKNCVSSSSCNNENEALQHELQLPATEVTAVCESMQTKSPKSRRVYKRHNSVVLEEGGTLYLPESVAHLVNSRSDSQSSSSTTFTEDGTEGDRGETSIENIQKSTNTNDSCHKEATSQNSQACPVLTREENSDRCSADSSPQSCEGVSRSPLQDKTNKLYQHSTGFSSSSTSRSLSPTRSRKSGSLTEIPQDIDTKSRRSSPRNKKDKSSSDDPAERIAAGFQPGVGSPAPSTETKSDDNDSVPKGGIALLHSCSACQSPSSELTLTQCFHLTCPKCVLPAAEHGRIQCGACKAQQVAPGEDGVASLADMFPDFLLMLDTKTAHSATETVSSERSTLGDGAEHRAARETTEGAEAVAGDGFLKTTDTHVGYDEKNAAVLGKIAAASLVATDNKDAGNNAEEIGKGQSLDERRDENAPLTTPADEDDNKERNDEVFSGEQNDSECVSSAAASGSDGSSFTGETATDSDKISNSHDRLVSGTDQAEAKEERRHLQQHQQHGLRNRHRSLRQQRCGACRAEAHIAAVAEGEENEEPLPFKHVCVTCGGILLCEGCRTAHATLPVTRLHEVVPVTGARDLTRLMSPLHIMTRRQPVCPRHGQEIALLCSTCSVFVCHRCLSPAHCDRQHEVQDLGHLYHKNRKKFSGLQRSVKQHLLAARAARRQVSEQLDRVEGQRQRVVDQVRDTAQCITARVEARSEELCREVEKKCGAWRQALNGARDNVAHALSEGEIILEALSAVGDSTPHLTSLVLQNVCQAQFDKLRRQAPLNVEEAEDVVLRPDSGLGAHLASPTCLGTVRTLASGIPSTCLHVVSVIHTGGEVSGIAVTPYNEVVTVSTTAGTCRIWNQDGTMLSDVSHHVKQPCDVQVTPNGRLIVVLTSSPVSNSSNSNSKNRSEAMASGAACLTLLSPAGSLLTRLPLRSSTSHVQFTHIHCPDDDRVLVSDEAARIVTLFALEKEEEEADYKEKSRLGPQRWCLRPVRRLSCSDQHLLQSPRHVTVSLTGDWLVNDGGYFLRAVSLEEGQVTTVLSEDEPDAALQPPTSRRPSRGFGEGGERDPSKSKRRRRLLTSVCCDSRGRIMVADAGKSGLYIATARPPERGGERRFVSLRELTPSSYCHVTAVTVDRLDRIVVGLSDGKVCVLEIESEEGD